MRIILSIFFGLLLFGCQNNDDQTLKIGTIAGPETALVETAQTILKKQKIDSKIVTFSDYMTPNRALAEGNIDANIYQHLPFLESTIKNQDYHFKILGKTFIYPMAIYSEKITDLKNLKPNATIAIPNDPSNEARALILCDKAGLIKLKSNQNTSATIEDIISNPLALKFQTLDAAQLPRVLEDVDLAVINTNYAHQANLSPKKNGLFVEDKNSLYANLIVVRDDNFSDPRLNALLEAMHSQAVMDKAKEIFHGEAIPAW